VFSIILSSIFLSNGRTGRQAGKVSLLLVLQVGYKNKGVEKNKHTNFFWAEQIIQKLSFFLYNLSQC
jgi:hypothetical protein